MNPIIINHLKKSDKKLAKVIDTIGELDIHGYNQSTDSFIFLVREIVGQMISSSVKKIIFERLLEICNYEISTSNILKLEIEDLRSIGLSQSKSRYIINLAKLVDNKEIDFDKIALLSDEDAKVELKKIDGIGNWTSKMYLIFFLQREDVLPFEDGAFLQSYKWLYNTSNIKPSSIEKKCKKWKPYSSIAARYLYRALDTGLTKIPIKNFLNNSDET